MQKSEHENGPELDTARMGSVQGEGDYEAAAAYRNDVRTFLEHADVEKAAREAEPRNRRQARELEQAEAEGRSHAKDGSQAADVRQTSVSVEALQDAIRERPVTAMIMAGVLAGVLGYLIGRIDQRS
jgi:hypothetical protein